jgi:hypothetical protein
MRIEYVIYKVPFVEEEATSRAILVLDSSFSA